MLTRPARSGVAISPAFLNPNSSNPSAPTCAFDGCRSFLSQNDSTGFCSAHISLANTGNRAGSHLRKVSSSQVLEQYRRTSMIGSAPHQNGSSNQHAAPTGHGQVNIVDGSFLSHSSSAPRLDNPSLKPNRVAQHRFLMSTFPAADHFLQELGNIDVNHPLGELLYETSMAMRELLNCYTNYDPNAVRLGLDAPDVPVKSVFEDTSLESLLGRTQRLHSIISNHAHTSAAKLKGQLEVQQTNETGVKSQFEQFHCQVNLYNLYIGKKYVVDLRLLINVMEYHSNNLSSEFSITLENKSSFLFRSTNDAERQSWLTIFRFYDKQRQLQSSVQSLSIKQRIELVTQCIHTPYTEENILTDFNFQPPKKNSDDGDDNNPNNNNNSSPLDELPNAAVNNKNKEFIFSTQDLPENSLRRINISERFPVRWMKKTFGKDSQRLLEFDLSDPPRLLIYKPEEKEPQNVIYREDFIDYKSEYDKFTIELCFMEQNSGKQKENSKRFVFQNLSFYNRFYDLLMLFQQPQNLEQFYFEHNDVMLVLRHFGSQKKLNNNQDENLKLLESALNNNQNNNNQSKELIINPSDLFQSKLNRTTSLLNSRPLIMKYNNKNIFQDYLNSLFFSMLELTPNSTYCKELYQYSQGQSKNEIGDYHRLKYLVSKLYMNTNNTTNSIQIDEIQCTCPSMGRVDTNSCVLYFFQSFLHNHGFQDLIHFTNPNYSLEFNQIGIRGIWQCNAIKHLINKCRTSITENGINDLDSDFIRLPFSFYIDSMTKNGYLEESIIDVLFEILIGEFRSNHISKEGKSEESLSDTQVQVMSKSIKFVGTVPLLLHSLVHATPQACELALTNFILLINDGTNTRSFLESLGWQNWFFPLLMDVAAGNKSAEYFPSEDPEAAAALEKKDLNTKIFNLTVSLVSSLHYHALAEKQEKPKFAYNIMHRTLCLLSDFASSDASTMGIFRILMICLLNMLKSRAQQYTENFSFDDSTLHRYENLFCLFEVVEEFVLFRGIFTAQRQGAASANAEAAQQQWINLHLDTDEAANKPSGSDPSAVALSPVNVLQASLGSSSAAYKCLDLPIIERVLEVMTALKIVSKSGDIGLTDSADEKKIKKRAIAEFEYWKSMSAAVKELTESKSSRPDNEQNKVISLFMNRMKERGNKLDKPPQFYKLTGPMLFSAKKGKDSKKASGTLNSAHAAGRAAAARRAVGKGTIKAKKDPQSTASSTSLKDMFNQGGSVSGREESVVSGQRQSSLADEVEDEEDEDEDEDEDDEHEAIIAPLGKYGDSGSTNENRSSDSSFDFGSARPRESRGPKLSAGGGSLNSFEAQLLANARSSLNNLANGGDGGINEINQFDLVDANPIESGPAPDSLPIIEDEDEDGGEYPVAAPQKSMGFGLPPSLPPKLPPKGPGSNFTTTPTFNLPPRMSATNNADSQFDDGFQQRNSFASQQSLSFPTPSDVPVDANSLNNAISAALELRQRRKSSIKVNSNARPPPPVVKPQSANTPAQQQNAAPAHSGFSDEDRAQIERIQAEIAEKERIQKAYAMATASAQANKWKPADQANPTQSASFSKPPEEAPKSGSITGGFTKPAGFMPPRPFGGSTALPSIPGPAPPANPPPASFDEHHGAHLRNRSVLPQNLELGRADHEPEVLTRSPLSMGFGAPGASLLSCSACNTPIPSTNFYEKDGQSYCERCYSARFSTCKKCFQPITDEEFISVKNAVYHPDCLVCCKCNQPLTEQMYERDGNVYCPRDYHANFSKQCFACKDKIIDLKCVEFEGKTYHLDHFRCSQCNVELVDLDSRNGEPAYYFNSSAQALYCLADYKKAFGNPTTCAVCKRTCVEQNFSVPIFNGASQDNTKKPIIAHPDCAMCCKCDARGSNPDSGICANAQGVMYCKAHWKPEPSFARPSGFQFGQPPQAGQSSISSPSNAVSNPFNRPSLTTTPNLPSQNSNPPVPSSSPNLPPNVPSTFGGGFSPGFSASPALPRPQIFGNNANINNNNNIAAAAGNTQHPNGALPQTPNNPSQAPPTAGSSFSSSFRPPGPPSQSSNPPFSPPSSGSISSPFLNNNNNGTGNRSSFGNANGTSGLPFQSNQPPAPSRTANATQPQSLPNAPPGLPSSPPAGGFRMPMGSPPPAMGSPMGGSRLSSPFLNNNAPPQGPSNPNGGSGSLSSGVNGFRPPPPPMKKPF